MRRQLTGSWLWIARITAIAFSLFQIFVAGYGQIPDMQLRALHVLFGLVLTLMLVSPAKRARPESNIPIWDILLILITIASSVNAYIKYEWYHLNIGVSTPLDLILGMAITVLAIETGRRVVGWTLPLLTLLLLLYSYFGYLIPGLFYHHGLSFPFIMQTIYQGTKGVFGFVTGVSANIIAIFLIFGSLLLFTGGGQTFIDLAIKITGRIRGGPALVAVIASAFFGTISGVSVVNVVTTGSFTIPLMKRLGYKPEFAGAVEAAASSGGIITPPIMGAGAFIMAEILGIPYLSVIKAAIVPAILYYVAVFTAVRFRALRLNLVPVPRDQIPSNRELFTWKRLSPLALPIAMILFLLVRGYSPASAGFWGCIASIVLFLFSNFSLSQMKERVKTIIKALEGAGMSLIEIISLVVCANIVVSLINLTGIGVKFSGLVIDIAGSFMVVALLLAAFVTIVIGMGMPATPSYLIGVSVMGGALIMLGALPIAAHFFIFYFAVFSAITPPVCTAAFAAATIAKANWFKIARTAIPLAIVGYAMPFIFIYEPALLLEGKPLEITIAALSAAMGAVFIGAGVAGYLNSKLHIAVRLLFAIAGVMLLVPNLQSDVIAIIAIVLSLLGQRFFTKKQVQG
jgi:TRAP transporter 4TM/12TM fusion protein